MDEQWQIRCFGVVWENGHGVFRELTKEEQNAVGDEIVREQMRAFVEKRLWEN